MTPQVLQERAARACAAVVLYRPDPGLVARLAAGLQGRTLFAFANGPVDGEVLSALAPTDLRLTTSGANLGLGHGLNAVMDAAARDGFSHVMLLDQDSEPPAELLPELAARMTSIEGRGERIGVLAPRLVPPREGFFKPLRYEWRGKPRPDGLAAVDFAPTSGSLVSTAAHAAVGRFRDDFFIAGIDVEWGFRAWAIGWPSLVATDLAMPHRWGEDVEPDERGKAQILRHAPIRTYYYSRNVVATARLAHVPWRWRAKSCAALAVQTLMLAAKGAPGALHPLRTGLRDGLAGRLGPAPADAIRPAHR